MDFLSDCLVAIIQAPMKGSAMEIQIGRMVVGSILLELLILARFFWSLYWITKKAISHGIKESGLIDELRRSARRNPNEQQEPSFMRDK